MSLLEELKQRLTAAYNAIDQIENRISDEQASLRRVAIGVTDLERAIAALEPAPAEPEAERELPSDEWYVTADQPAEPEAEPVAPDQMFAGVPAWANERWHRDAHLRSFIVDESAVFHDGGPMPVSDNAIVDIYFDGDLLRDKLAEDYDWIDFECAYRVVMQPARELYEDPTIDAITEYMERETHTDGVRNDSQQDEGAGERADPQTSITQDPELLAAVSRAEATLAAAEPAYVGLQDPELDAQYDAMKERQEAGRKLHFSIFGKREEV